MTNKNRITISVPGDITEEEIKSMRKEFNECELSKDYRLNIIISGCSDAVSNLGAVLAAYVKK